MYEGFSHTEGNTIYRFLFLISCRLWRFILVGLLVRNEDYI